jgi:hypothetical protein
MRCEEGLGILQSWPALIIATARLRRPPKTPQAGEILYKIGGGRKTFGRVWSSGWRSRGPDAASTALSTNRVSRADVARRRINVVVEDLPEDLGVTPIHPAGQRPPPHRPFVDQRLDAPGCENMTVVDAIYRAAGLPLREPT